jgi:hypothetical protein
MARTGVAVLIILVAMAGGWAARQLLLRRMRARHQREFDALGSPSSRELSSMLPKHNELQVRFWKYLWGGKFLVLDDRRVSILAGAALISDAALVAGVALLFWSVGR